MRDLRTTVRLTKFRLENLSKDKFTCPVCAYQGPFADVKPPTGFRKHAQCPSCGALERHRIQYLVMNDVLKPLNTARLKMLHFAPEGCFKEVFAKQFGQYETADLHMQGVDHKVAIEKLPFDDATYDCVFASHVLEHIRDDAQAVSEIRRVLKPGGMAVLPVPLVAEKTVEYPAPNPNETYHVRAPGFDYFDRYERSFSRVVKFSSDALPSAHQLFVYEDRSRWPTSECPLRPPMKGEKHSDIVPVCYV
jgi:SAM-dependent methyltransferase